MTKAVKTSQHDGRGYTKSFRRKWQHPVFRNLRDAGIWSWMIDTAAWADTTVRFGNAVVSLKRGQLVTTERFVADGFCADRQVVRRLWDALEANHMISREKTQQGTIVTICNYEKFQGLQEDENPPQNPGQTHLEPTSNPNKNEVKKEVISGGGDPRADVGLGYAGADEVARGFIGARERHYPRDSRMHAPTMTLKAQATEWLKAGGTVELLIDAIDRGTRWNVENGRAPPTSIDSLRSTIQNAVAAYRSAQKPITIPEGKPNGQHGSNPQARHADDTSRRRTGLYRGIADSLGNAVPGADDAPAGDGGDLDPGDGAYPLRSAAVGGHA